MTAPILALDGLACHFPVRNAWGWRTGAVRALDGVDLGVEPGAVLGIVGESGCGKSTLGKVIAGIHRPTGGTVRFEGADVTRLTPSAGRSVRRHLQYCYQDPGASLDPRWTVRASLEEPLVVHTALSASERRERVAETLDAVGLPLRHLALYPHELSGGQQRRVGLARVLMLRPRLVILDEPTSGLDVSVQATVLRLLVDLRARFDLTYLFISHDLSVVRLFSQRIAVMYLGRIVEIGDTEAVFADPRHPYTRSLLAAVPEVGGRRVIEHFALTGEPPDPRAIPPGCRFRPRCPLAQPVCAADDPVLRPVAPADAAACHFADRVPAGGAVTAAGAGDGRPAAAGC